MTETLQPPGAVGATIRDACVLVVDDIQSNRRFLCQHLKRQGIENIIEAADGLEAMAVLTSQVVDLVLLDVMMPRMDGHQVLVQIRGDAQLRRVPVIMITALDDMESAVRCIENGAEDYVLKPFNPVLLRARVTAILEKKRLREMEREYLRAYDATTTLPNRDTLLGRLQQEMLRWQSHQRPYGLLFVLLDRYRMILDSLGEGAGDEYLVAQANRLVDRLPSTAFTGRCGQNAFGVLAVELERSVEASLLGWRIQETLARPLDIRGHQVAGGVGVGITLGESGYLEPHDMLRDAALAAKRVDKGDGCRFFDEAMHVEAMTRLELGPALQRALDDGQLLLYYQPIVALEDQTVAGLEALIRWQHPQRGMVPPDQFIRLAEETGLIVPMGRWVTLTACQQLAYWQARRGDKPPLYVGINVSAREFGEADFVSVLSQALAPIADRPQTLKLELTETLLIDKPHNVERIIGAVNAMGVPTVLDDFGTGYCSLSYLHRFPFETLKIDQSFIRDIDTQARNRKIVHSTILMAHSLDMSVVAEGIENQAEADIVRDMGCEYGQGAFFSMPVPAEVVEKMF